jgi:hypothetical protein
MPRATSKKRTNTGLSKIGDKSPDNRPKTRRLEGGGDFPLIFLFTRHLPNGLPPAKHFFRPCSTDGTQGTGKQEPGLDLRPHWRPPEAWKKVL